MSAALPSTVAPPLTGWRCWRVMPFERLGEHPSVRLCASGTRGIPKVWTPRLPVSAICGKFKTTHAAPWPGCECGIYAYREREPAEAHFASFTSGSSEGTVGWAFGRVSLWGKIVEAEHGWRSEFAYPYELIVYAEPEVAREIRGLYGVDVEQQAPIEPAEPEPPEVERGTGASIKAQLREIEERLGAIGQRLGARPATVNPRHAEKVARERKEKAWKEYVATLPPLPAQLEASDGELLLAVFTATVQDSFDWQGKEYPAPTSARTVRPCAVLEALLTLRGIPGMSWGWGNYARRDGYRSLHRRVSVRLAQIGEDGLLAGGHFPNNPRGGREWRLTEAGRARLREHGVPSRITFYRELPHDGPPGFEESIVPTKDAWRRLSLPPKPFEHELQESAPGWRAERRAAARKGRKALTAWCDRQRALAAQLRTGEGKMLALTDDEVEQALRRLSRKGPVEFGTLAELLAPGNRTQSETSVIAQTLFRFHRDGRAGREDTPDGRVWLPVGEAAA